MVLRAAARADIGALCDAWYAMLSETEALAKMVDAAWPDLLGEHFSSGIASRRQMWNVIEVDGHIVSTGGLFLTREPSTVALCGLGATIAGVYTYPHSRRRGYARAIVERLIAAAKNEGCLALRLRASAAGRPLYEQFGFRAGDEMFLNL
jgi:GNAT superfamily N-acetyltransferase